MCVGNRVYFITIPSGPMLLRIRISLSPLQYLFPDPPTDPWLTVLQYRSLGIKDDLTKENWSSFLAYNWL